MGSRRAQPRRPAHDARHRQLRSAATASIGPDSWTFARTEQRPRQIMRNIHDACRSATEQYGTPGDYLAGANITGFQRVAEAMLPTASSEHAASRPTRRVDSPQMSVFTHGRGRVSGRACVNVDESPAMRISPSHDTPQPSVTSDGSVPDPIRLLLVDDHPAVRLGMRQLIDQQSDMRVVAAVAGVPEALSQPEWPIDVAIVDYHLGEAEDGLWLTTQLKRIATPPQVLVYTAFADGALAVAALIAGADGLLGKHELGDELCCAIRRLARGQHNLPAINPSIAHAMRPRFGPRDRAIFSMLLHGIAPDAIAAALSMTPDEVDDRRLIMLRSLKPVGAHSGLPRGARAPLDYERPKRRRSRWAA
jgi:DNA-binding NarL/FixJ family response regulator